MWCSALGCYLGVGETGRKDTVSGGDAGGDADAGSKTGDGSCIDGDGDGDRGAGGDREGDELEERSWKRPRIGMTEG